MVIARHLVEERLVIGVERDRRRQRPHGRVLDRSLGDRWQPLAQQLDGVTEADPVLLDHPINRPAGRAAAEAMPKVLVGRHRQRRLVVVVERARPHKVAPALLQLDAAALDQPRDRHLRLQPLQLRFGDARHGRPSCQKTGPTQKPVKTENRQTTRMRFTLIKRRVNVHPKVGVAMNCNTIRTATVMPTSMSPDEKMFFQAMGGRIADSRKALGMTQVQLADELGVAQQVVASYEVGRHRVPASFLPRLARVLAISVEELVGEETQRPKRGPAPKLLQQIERIHRLPKSQQRFVMQMIDTALQASATDAAE